MSRHLKALGHEVTLITTNAFGGLESDRSDGVIRTADLASSPLLRRVLRRPSVRGAGENPPLQAPPPPALTRFMVPDPLLLAWNPWAAGAIRRTLAACRFDCLITSVPAESTALLGLLFRRRIAWLCDFRDPWRFESLRPSFPTAVQERLDGQLERVVTQRADAITAVQRSVAADLGRRYGIEAIEVPNGWDPADATAQRSSVPLAQDPGLFRIVHTGTLSGSWGRDPEPFLRALAPILRRYPHVRLVLAGRQSTEDERLLKRYEGAPSVVELGHLDRATTLALQRSADLLVVIGSERKSEAPGKTLEYLAARRPILVLGAQSESARIVEEAQAGLSVPARDVEAIASVLEQAVKRELVVKPTDVSDYVYPAPARRMTEAIERAIDRSAERLAVR